ncbi:hypothetical protein N7462_006548 [Penicillium macrosclerotiorum]|uniref:uncharacterized protein n=1 Tax=Penicillium macrosclerotiorum TaxID=303699 RepID=UPI002547D7D4|nr:uncharacterized protein N7462_006548 [Penicillium macrosclerotiorum]KAJ5683383.1 hypothetical protein N7462_006548 [Penicillium macrosclerotiorum]
MMNEVAQALHLGNLASPIIQSPTAPQQQATIASAEPEMSSLDTNTTRRAQRGGCALGLP